MQLPITRIMAPVDGSKNSLAALQTAVTLAKDYRAELVIVHVLTTHSVAVSLSSVSSVPSVPTAETVFEEEDKNARAMLDEPVAFAKKHGVKARGELLSKRASVVEAIVAEAIDEKVDLIVIGTRGLGGFKRLLIGSVSTGVVIHAHCPVLVVR